MLNIIAIGGGGLEQGETLKIDEIIVRCTGKTHPTALFIPTASDDSLEYWEIFHKVYGGQLQCKTEVLYLIKEHLPSEDIQGKIERADLIYVGGGNTRKMLALWRDLGVDQILLRAAQRGTVLSGLSAGANCWFRYANSDAPILEGEEGVKTTRVEGLNLVDVALCPHMKREAFRLEEFTNMMRTTPGIGIGLDDNCAFQIRGQEYRFLAAEDDAKAHKLFWEGEKLHHEYLYPTEDFHALSTLIS